MKIEDIEIIHRSNVNGEDTCAIILIDAYGKDFWKHYKQYLYSKYCPYKQYKYFSELSILYLLRHSEKILSHEM